MWTASRADIDARFCAISPARRTSAFSIPKNLVNDVQTNLEGWSDGFPFVDCRVPMQDLLQHFRVGDQSLPRRDKAFQQNLRLRLVRMRRADEVHRDIGIDEDQA